LIQQLAQPFACPVSRMAVGSPRRRLQLGTECSQHLRNGTGMRARSLPATCSLPGGALQIGIIHPCAARCPQLCGLHPVQGQHMQRTPAARLNPDSPAGTVPGRGHRQAAPELLALQQPCSSAATSHVKPMSARHAAAFHSRYVRCHVVRGQAFRCRLPSCHPAVQPQTACSSLHRHSHRQNRTYMQSCSMHFARRCSPAQRHSYTRKTATGTSSAPAASVVDATMAPAATARAAPSL
jgi:hypothetical protein